MNLWRRRREALVMNNDLLVRAARDLLTQFDELGRHWPVGMGLCRCQKSLPCPVKNKVVERVEDWNRTLVNAGILAADVKLAEAHTTVLPRTDAKVATE